jgi:hypothetical protein
MTEYKWAQSTELEIAFAKTEKQVLSGITFDKIDLSKMTMNEVMSNPTLLLLVQSIVFAINGITQPIQSDLDTLLAQKTFDRILKSAQKMNSETVTLRVENGTYFSDMAVVKTVSNSTDTLSLIGRFDVDRKVYVVNGLPTMITVAIYK